MHKSNYIQYNKIGDLTSSGVAAGSSAARVLATGGLDIGADITLALTGFQFVGDLWNQWTSTPAADARDYIKNLKPKLASADPYNRLVQLMAGDTKINHRAKDVSARELVLWYRQNYPDDYKTLKPDAKTYFNNYLVNAANGATDVNQASKDYINAQFTTTETNYNASPIQTASNLLKNLTSGGASGKVNWVLYGAIALGVILILKNIKK